MKTQRKIVTLSLTLMLLVAAPTIVFALPLIDPYTVDYVWSRRGQTYDYAEMTVEVHKGSYTGKYSNDINVSLSDGEFIYVYEILNRDTVSSIPNINSIKLIKTEESLILGSGSLSGNAQFLVEGGDILIYGLGIGPLSSDVVYMVSNHIPGQLLNSYVVGSLGTSQIAQIYAPNQEPNHENNAVPEPTTLLLLGSGLLASGLYRRIKRRKTS